MKKLIPFLLLGVLAAGCIEPVYDGVVVDKRHQDAFVSFVVMGKTMIPIHHPEQWKLCVEGDGRKCWWTVSEKEYNEYQIGDEVHFTRPE